MKRALSWSATLLATLALAGCPIYPDDGSGCYSDSDCGHGYVCDYPSGMCMRTDHGRECTSPSECAFGYTCGSDYRCHSGSCYQRNGDCVAGYSCQSSYNGVWQCLAGQQPPPQYDSGVFKPDAGPIDGGAADVSLPDATADASSGEDATAADATTLDAAEAGDAAVRDARAD